MFLALWMKLYKWNCEKCSKEIIKLHFFDTFLLHVWGKNFTIGKDNEFE